MTISEAASRGITRVRHSGWISKNAYFKLDLYPDGTWGPWIHLYDREFQQFLGQSTPTHLLSVLNNGEGYEPYRGERDKDDLSP